MKNQKFTKAEAGKLIEDNKKSINSHENHVKIMQDCLVKHGFEYAECAINALHESIAKRQKSISKIKNDIRKLENFIATGQS